MSPREARKFYIHVGPHKTGTTVIQQFLADNADKLLETGIVYPKLTFEGRPNNSHKGLLIKEVRRDGRIDLRADGWTLVAGALSERRHDVLISHESFAGRLLDETTRDSILSLAQSHGYAVHVIAYVRNQPDWLNSWYVQQQKRFYAKNTFEEFVRSSAKEGRVDPWRYLKGLIDNPNVHLEVVSFDAAIRKGLEDDFVRRVGASPDGSWRYPRRVNTNAGMKTIYVAQNVLDRSPMPPVKAKNYDKIKTVLRRSRTEHGWRDTAFMALDDEIAAGIREHYAASNKRFLEKFPIGSYEEVFPERKYSRNVFDPLTTTESERQDVDATIEKILRLLQKAKRG